MDDIAEGRCGAALVGVVCDDESDGIDNDEPGDARAAGLAGGRFDHV